MNRSIASFLILCLFLWVLPLGHFIKLSQEKTACGGGRAMHMCTMGMGKVHTDTERSSKIVFSNPSGLDKDPRSNTSGAANDVLLNLRTLQALEKGEQFVHAHFLTHYSYFLNILSPPPKIKPII